MRSLVRRGGVRDGTIAPLYHLPRRPARACGLVAGSCGETRPEGWTRIRDGRPLPISSRAPGQTAIRRPEAGTLSRQRSQRVRCIAMLDIGRLMRSAEE